LEIELQNYSFANGGPSWTIPFNFAVGQCITTIVPPEDSQQEAILFEFEVPWGEATSVDLSSLLSVYSDNVCAYVFEFEVMIRNYDSNTNTYSIEPIPPPPPVLSFFEPPNSELEWTPSTKMLELEKCNQGLTQGSGADPECGNEPYTKTFDLFVKATLKNPMNNDIIDTHVPDGILSQAVPNNGIMIAATIDDDCANNVNTLVFDPNFDFNAPITIMGTTTPPIDVGFTIEQTIPGCPLTITVGGDNSGNGGGEPDTIETDYDVTVQVDGVTEGVVTVTVNSGDSELVDTGLTVTLTWTDNGVEQSESFTLLFIHECDPARFSTLDYTDPFEIVDIPVNGVRATTTATVTVRLATLNSAYLSSCDSTLEYSIVDGDTDISLDFSSIPDSNTPNEILLSPQMIHASTTPYEVKARVCFT
jgi:hypothetical protein